MKKMIWIAICSLCLLAGIAFAAPRPVQLDNTDGKTVVLVPGQELVITLDGNITTGHAWQLAEAIPELLTQVGDDSYKARPAQPGMTGTGGTWTWRFKAIAPGSGQLKLFYSRYNGPVSRTFSATVIVK